VYVINNQLAKFPMKRINESNFIFNPLFFYLILFKYGMSLLLFALSHDFLIVSLIIHSPLRLFSINYSQLYAFSFSLEIKILEVKKRKMKRINLVIFMVNYFNCEF